MSEDDAALVQRCLAGEESGMRALVERFQGLVFGLCFRMLNHREDAEDVAQDVFVRTFRSLTSWDSTRPLKPWVLTIAANRCRTALQKRTRRPVATELAGVLAEDDRKPPSDLAEELQIALERLRQEYRTCFILFYQQELNLVEIAEIMNCPQGTIKTWLHRARKEMAEHLQRRGIGPESHHELHRV